MTASATSSPITLLGSVADTAKTAAPAAATASSDAGGEGFQLLLAQAAEAVRSAAGLLATHTDIPADASDDPEQPANADGNALPPLGALLPLAPTAATTESKTDTDTDSDKKSADSDSDTDDTALLASAGLVVALPLAPVTPAAAEPVSVPVAETSTGVAMVSAIATAPVASPVTSIETRAQSAAPAAESDQSLVSNQPPAPTAAQAALTLPVAAAAGSASGDGSASSAGVAATAKTENLVPLSAVKIATESRGDASADAAQSVAARAANFTADGGPEKSARAEATGESDFDALIKQLDAANSTGSATTTSAPSTAAGVDGSRVVHQAARAYAAPHTATATVSVPVTAEGWSDAVTDKVMWFSAQNINSAEIHLNPPDLGPLQVRISTQQDQTSIVFSSQHAAVRDALDQALPRLRDMLGGQGLQQVDVGVGQGNARQHDHAQQNSAQQNNGQQARAAANGFFGDGSDSGEPIAVTSIAASRLTRAGIDAYA